MTRLAELTTTGIGGEAASFAEPATRDELVAVAREAFAAQTDEAPVLIVGGGSNLLVSDGPVSGAVIRVATRGVEFGEPDASGRTLVVAEAGEPWAALVDACVDRGLAGIEALAGIPGTAGAAPVQNIGAYGQELASVLTRIELLDAEDGSLEWIDADDLDLAYRTSRLKRGELRGLVTRIELALRDVSADGIGEPVQYGQLASALGVELGERVPLREARDAVVALRRSKGMVLDPGDPDTRSTGSFFTNPVVSQEFARAMPEDMPRYPAPEAEDGTKLVKLSAAWLIDHAGVKKGFALPGSKAAVSSKHTLAITNRGGATAEEIAELARFIGARVRSEYGVDLRPEPVVIGLDI
ncbi:UDP-N-acetylenolpyruvoylglucosamine reductase [Pseudoclavibacter triregionum]|nr:UDP-N-acetylenolpyruvoylglucosamine reductase [Pseudoclavibacter triregionum]